MATSKHERSRASSGGGNRGTDLAAFLVIGLHLQQVIRDRRVWAGSKALAEHRVHHCPLVRRNLAYFELVRIAAACNRDLFGDLAGRRPHVEHLLSRHCAQRVIDTVRDAPAWLVEGVAHAGGSRSPDERLMPAARSLAIDLSVRLAAAHLLFSGEGVLDHVACWGGNGTFVHYLLRVFDERGLVRSSGARTNVRTRQRHLLAARHWPERCAPRPTLAAIQSLVDDPARVSALRSATLVDDIAERGIQSIGERRVEEMVRSIVAFARILAAAVPLVFRDYAETNDVIGSVLGELAGAGARSLRGSTLLAAVANAMRSPILVGELMPLDPLAVPWSDLLAIVAGAERRGRLPGGLPRAIAKSAASHVVAALARIDVRLITGEHERTERLIERCELAIVAALLRSSSRRRGTGGSFDTALEKLALVAPAHPLLAIAGERRSRLG